MQTIAITGASGFIGTALSKALSTAGRDVRPLVRPGHTAKGGIGWDPQAGTIDDRALEGVDALIHLAGESVANGRWNEAQKAKIKDSRVRGTTLLARTLAGLRKKPFTWISASAIGYYGDRGEGPLDETSERGNDFLAEVSAAWEAATAPAEQAGIRVVHARLGVVLDPAGGALAKMATPFKLGLGGRIGSGRQFVSFISRNDAVRAFSFLLDRDDLRGPFNLTAPRPVTNAELTRALGRALSRPTLLPLPALLARLALGEMADAALLGSARVLPRRLLDNGFVFEDDDLETFLVRAFA